MDLGGIGWGLQTIIGAAILAAVLLWLVLRNREISPEDKRRTDEGTRKLYEEEDREHGHESDDVP